jgi:hypothetical protein
MMSQLFVCAEAEREKRDYEAFKQQNKPKSFSYVGTAGGGEVGASIHEARAQQMQVHASTSKINRLVSAVFIFRSRVRFMYYQMQVHASTSKTNCLVSAVSAFLLHAVFLYQQHFSFLN